MNREEIATFTRKIANSNPSELICVYYEMYFAYEKDLEKALEEEDHEAYMIALRKMSQIVQHLRDVLDFKYDLANQLYSLYTFVERTLAKATYKRDRNVIADADKVMRPLQEAFIEVAKADQREPMMANTEAVTTGLTYGRDHLTDSVASDVARRGFYV